MCLYGGIKLSRTGCINHAIPQPRLNVTHMALPRIADRSAEALSPFF